MLVIFLIYFVPATAFWCILFFFLAWFSADSGPAGKNLTIIIAEELQRGSSIMIWWLCHTFIMIAIFIFSLVGLLYLRKRWFNQRFCFSPLSRKRSKGINQRFFSFTLYAPFPFLLDHNSMKTKPLILLAVCQALLVGCASYNYTDAPPTLGVMYSRYAHIGYDGAIRPIDDIGLVSTDGLIRIHSLDGKPMNDYRIFKTSGFYSGGRYQLHLLPGAHILTMGFHDDRGGGSISWSTSDITRIINIRKGQVIHFALSQDGRTWTAKEFDGSSALPIIKDDFNELTATKWPSLRKFSP